MDWFSAAAVSIGIVIGNLGYRRWVSPVLYRRRQGKATAEFDRWMAAHLKLERAKRDWREGIERKAEEVMRTRVSK